MQKTFAEVLPLLFLFALCLSGGVASSDRREYCHVANDTCFQSSHCGAKLRLLGSVCGDYKTCELSAPKALEICRDHLRSLPTYVPTMNCFCPATIYPQTNYNRCLAVWKSVHQHACMVDSPKQQQEQQQEQQQKQQQLPTPNTLRNSATTSKPLGSPAQSVAEYIERVQQLAEDSLPEDDARHPSCLLRRASCFDRPDCTRDANNFRQRCVVAEPARDCPARRAPCLESYEALRQHRFIPCSCANHSGTEKLQCEQIRKLYPGNACLRFYNDAYNNGLLHPKVKGTSDQQTQQGQQQQRNPDQQNQLSVPQSTGSAVATQPETFEQIKPSNCFDVYQSCSRHFDCLQRLVSLSEACVWLPALSRCQDRSLCLAQLDAFYTYADRFANEAATCDCPEGDTDCSRLARATFRPACAYEPPPPPSQQLPDSGGGAVSCLHIVKLCQTDKRRGCLARFARYSHACGEVGGVCTGSTSSCHLTRRLLLGTELTQRCDCQDLVEGDSQVKLCEYLRTLLSKPRCLRCDTHHPIPGVTSRDACALAQRHGFLATGRTSKLVPSQHLRIAWNSSCSRLCVCSATVDATYTTVCPEDVPPICSPPPPLSAIDSGGGGGGPPSRDTLQPPGLYLSLAFSRTALATAHRVWGVQLNIDWTRTIRDLLAKATTATAAKDCQLADVTESVRRPEPEDSDDGLVLLRLLADSPGSDDSKRLHYCLRHLKFLALMVAKQHPAIALSPELAHLRAAQWTYVNPPRRQQQQLAETGIDSAQPHRDDDGNGGGKTSVTSSAAQLLLLITSLGLLVRVTAW